MFEQATLRTAVRFGILAAAAGLLVMLAVYIAGRNPYGQYGFGVLFLLPVFLFTGLAHYKKYTDPDLKFFKGLKVSWLISLVAAITFAAFIYIFSIAAGAEAIQLHIQEMKAMMEQNKAQFLKLPNGQQAYDSNYQELDRLTPYSLVFDNFLKMLIIGFLFSFVSATFYRK